MRAIGGNMVHARKVPASRRLRRRRPVGAAVLGALVSAGLSGLAHGAEDDDARAAAAKPNVYLDLRTTYARVPANTLSIGFGSSSLSSAIATLRALAPLVSGGAAPVLPRLPSTPNQTMSIDMPLTVDVSDRLSLYGGITASTSQGGLAGGWSDFAVSSWMAGFQADLYKQDGGSIPTITLQSTLTRSVPDSPLATTSLATIVEFNYALNDDETRGLLAGAQYTQVEVDSPLARIGPAIVGYVGGYYQWENNWKFTGRAGIQSFDGAQLLNLVPFRSFTQPIVRLDLDRNDDNDNRLFGVTAEIAWLPKPAYTLTLRTPLYAIRN